MKVKIITIIASLGLILGFTTPLFAPSFVSAAACGESDANFLGFPTWYRGVADDSSGSCTVNFNGASDQLGPFIWKIALNIIEIALRIVAVVAVGYILYGGFTYLTANGVPEKAAKGLNLIMSAAIGLIISIASIGIINTIFGIIPSGKQAVDGMYQLSVGDVIGNIMDVVYWITGAVAVIVLIISGIRFITSGNNPAGAQKARSSIIYSIIGLIVIILAFTITQIILGFFK